MHYLIRWPNHCHPRQIEPFRSAGLPPLSPTTRGRDLQRRGSFWISSSPPVREAYFLRCPLDANWFRQPPHIFFKNSPRRSRRTSRGPNLSGPDRPAVRLQESFQLCVRNMGTFCLNGNTTELRLPAMHYSASRPLSQADRKRSQMERFEDAVRQSGRSGAQTVFTSGHPEAALPTIRRKISQSAETFQEVLSAFGRRRHIFSRSLSTALFPFSLHSRKKESGFHKAVQQSIRSQVGMIHSLLGPKQRLLT